MYAYKVFIPFFLAMDAILATPIGTLLGMLMMVLLPPPDYDDYPFHHAVSLVANMVAAMFVKHLLGDLVPQEIYCTSLIAICRLSLDASSPGPYIVAATMLAHKLVTAEEDHRLALMYLFMFLFAAFIPGNVFLALVHFVTTSIRLTVAMIRRLVRGIISLLFRTVVAATTTARRMFVLLYIAIKYMYTALLCVKDQFVRRLARPLMVDAGTQTDFPDEKKPTPAPPMVDGSAQTGPIPLQTLLSLNKPRASFLRKIHFDDAEEHAESVPEECATIKSDSRAYIRGMWEAKKASKASIVKEEPAEEISSTGPETPINPPETTTTEVHPETLLTEVPEQEDALPSTPLTEVPQQEDALPSNITPSETPIVQLETSTTPSETPIVPLDASSTEAHHKDILDHQYEEEDIIDTHPPTADSSPVTEVSEKVDTEVMQETTTELPNEPTTEKATNAVEEVVEYTTQEETLPQNNLAENQHQAGISAPIIPIPVPSSDVPEEVATSTSAYKFTQETLTQPTLELDVEDAPLPGPVDQETSPPNGGAFIFGNNGSFDFNNQRLSSNGEASSFGNTEAPPSNGAFVFGNNGSFNFNNDAFSSGNNEAPRSNVEAINSGSNETSGPNNGVFVFGGNETPASSSRVRVHDSNQMVDLENDTILNMNDSVINIDEETNRFNNEMLSYNNQTPNPDDNAVPLDEEAFMRAFTFDESTFDFGNASNQQNPVDPQQQVNLERGTQPTFDELYEKFFGEPDTGVSAHNHNDTPNAHNVEAGHTTNDGAIPDHSTQAMDVDTNVQGDSDIGANNGAEFSGQISAEDLATMDIMAEWLTQASELNNQAADPAAAGQNHASEQPYTQQPISNQLPYPQQYQPVTETYEQQPAPAVDEAILDEPMEDVPETPHMPAAPDVDTDRFLSSTANTSITEQNNTDTTTIPTNNHMDFSFTFSAPPLPPQESTTQTFPRIFNFLPTQDSAPREPTPEVSTPIPVEDSRRAPISPAPVPDAPRLEDIPQSFRIELKKPEKPKPLSLPPKPSPKPELKGGEASASQGTATGPRKGGYPKKESRAEKICFHHQKNKQVKAKKPPAEEAPAED